MGRAFAGPQHLRWRPRRAPYQRAIARSVVDNRDMSGLRHKSIWLEARLPLRRAGMRPQKSGKRGFCGTCGSLLTWKACDEAAIAIALGAVDGATPFKLEKHIFAAEKSNYYEISESVPQF